MRVQIKFSNWDAETALPWMLIERTTRAGDFFLHLANCRQNTTVIEKLKQVWKKTTKAAGVFRLLLKKFTPCHIKMNLAI